jgi:hypothetical protein
MKRVIAFFMFSACMLGMPSCQKETPESAGTEEVTLSVVLPGEIDTKAISDGEKADVLYYATYTTEGKLIANLSNTVAGVRASSDKTFYVNLKLVKGFDYNVVFWAQDADCNAFTLDWKTPVVTVDYKAAANDDTRDAFYASKMLRAPFTDPKDRTVYLHRPFAQINFGASDYESIVDYYTKEEVDKGMSSSLVISAQVPSQMNLLDGKTSEPASAEFSLDAIPNDPRMLKVNGVDYKYVSMNYVLAPSGNTPDVFDYLTGKFVLKVGDKNVIERAVEVKNVPYLRNHRTNIVGDFFTENAELKVIIDNDFYKDDLEPNGPVTIK